MFTLKVRDAFKSAANGVRLGILSTSIALPRIGHLDYPDGGAISVVALRHLG